MDHSLIKKFVLLLVIAVTVCFSTDSGAYRLEWYLSRKLGIRFPIPPTWLKTANNKYSSVKLLLKDLSGAVISFATDEKGPQFDYSKWQNAIEKNLGKKKFKKISSSDVSLPGDRKVKMTNWKNKSRLLTTVDFVHGKYAFIFVFTCDPNEKRGKTGREKDMCSKSEKDFITLLSRISLF
ncbi:hypothetical protein KKF34_09650 [Myxococcota bacterium]|nr:hypothetical protein [Myxococcota bacterium]MBU1379806.1 hypothetical protein [Myxococcota bacterium]MBU1497128.1 hypothetical protein [Myxococcota bacterium]